MGKKTAPLVLLAVLLLAGCRAGGEASASSTPPEGATASVQSEAPPVPSAPGTPEELLAQQTIDDFHKAFLVDTGGRMGTLLVTTELVPYEEPVELLYYLHVSIWDPANPSQPIQMQEINWETVHYGEHQVLDVNFDGYQDFTYLYARGIQVEMYHCMLWNEELGLFQELPVYAEIPSPRVDPETETITGWSRSSGAGDGDTPVYRWVDGELVCVRFIRTFLKDWSDYDSPMVLTVKDRIDGELTEVYRVEFPPESAEYLTEQMRWEDLSYHGEEEE
ncbi:MAG: hypothetical protein HFF50_03715 [Lawsonibacter sp.]|nr:hypothetical protein [Lawsonibacter sp.]